MAPQNAFEKFRPMKPVLIIDIEVGNHQSVANAIDYLGYDYVVSNDKDEIAAAACYVLPGVGAFPEAMKNLNRLDLADALKREVLEKKKPILGICLGMQVFADSSEERDSTNAYQHKGLGWIRGAVRRLPAIPGLKVPQIGWNTLSWTGTDAVFSRLGPEAAFYFDHSYHFVCENKTDVAATCSYGTDIVSAVKHDNIFGVQFHPEKSQTAGLKFFRAFFDAAGQRYRKVVHHA